MQDLQIESSQFDTLVIAKNYSSARAKKGEIQEKLQEKAEFLRWRKVEKIYDRQLSIDIAEKHMRKGFWPAKVSEDGQYLIYPATTRLWRINLGNIGSKRYSTESFRARDTISKITYFYTDSENYSYVLAERNGKMDVWNTTTNHELSLASMLPGTKSPSIFAVGGKGGSIAVGSFQDGKLSSIHTGFSEGEEFTDVLTQNYRFVKMEISESGELAYTLDDQGNIKYWDIEGNNFLQVQLGAVKDFITLKENAIVSLEQNKIVVSTYHKDTGKTETKLVDYAESGENFYYQIAVSPDKTRLFALRPSGQIDILDLTDEQKKILLIDLTKELGDCEVKSFGIGINDQLVFTLADGRVLIFGQKAH